MTQLRQLLDLGERAAQDIVKRKNEFRYNRAAINWADVHCVNVEWFLNVGKESGFRFWFEEASEHNPAVVKAIKEFLAAHGEEGAEVVLEW